MFLDTPFAKAASLYMALFDLLTSPAMAMAVTKLTSLFWAFQLHGWSYCIPCIAFAIHKMADLRAERAAGRQIDNAVRAEVSARAPERRRLQRPSPPLTVHALAAA